MDFISALTKGSDEQRRKYAQLLTRNNLTERGLITLGACYAHCVSPVDKPEKIYSGSVDSAIKVLGLVIQELVCTKDLNIKMSAFVERLINLNDTHYEYTRMRIYAMAAMRCLAVFGVLRPVSKKRGDIPFDSVDITKINEVYDIDVGWMNQRLIPPESRIIQADDMEELLKSLTPRQCKIITGQRQSKPAQRAETDSADRITSLENYLALLAAENGRLWVEINRLKELQLQGLCKYLDWPQAAP